MNRRKHNFEIDPDEIFLDASNAPAFDRARFEGRLEKPLSPRAFVSLFSALALLLLAVYRAGRVWGLENWCSNLPLCRRFAKWRSWIG